MYAIEVHFLKWPKHLTKKNANILQPEHHRKIRTKSNTGTAISRSVPEVPQPYHTSGTDVLSKRRLLLKSPTRWPAELFQFRNHRIQNLITSSIIPRVRNINFILQTISFGVLNIINSKAALKSNFSCAVNTHSSSTHHFKERVRWWIYMHCNCLPS